MSQQSACFRIFGQNAPPQFTDKMDAAFSLANESAARDGKPFFVLRENSAKAGALWQVLANGERRAIYDALSPNDQVYQSLTLSDPKFVGNQGLLADSRYADEPLLPATVHLNHPGWPESALLGWFGLAYDSEAAPEPAGYDALLKSGLSFLTLFSTPEATHPVGFLRVHRHLTSDGRGKGSHIIYGVECETPYLAAGYEDFGYEAVLDWARSQLVAHDLAQLLPEFCLSQVALSPKVTLHGGDSLEEAHAMHTWGTLMDLVGEHLTAAGGLGATFALNEPCLECTAPDPTELPPRLECH